MEKLSHYLPLQAWIATATPRGTRRYLAGDPTLVNYNLIYLNGLLSIKETRHKALVFMRSTPPATVNRVHDAQTQLPPSGRPQPYHIHPKTWISPPDYPPPRGVPWKHIAEMVRSNTSCLGCHFNKPDDFPRLKFHQDVRFPDLAKHVYICRKYVMASATIVKKLNNNLPRTPDQTRQPGARRASEETGS